MTVQDPIELLLPEADEDLRDLARRVTTLARLVVDDARPKLAQSERLDFASAREELEREQADRLARALDALLAAYATQAAKESDSFLAFAPRECGFQGAWEIVLDARAEHARLPGLPTPGESPLAVGHRLCAALGELRAVRKAACRATWLAVLHALRWGPVAGETELRAVLMSLEEGAERAPEAESRLVAHVAECMLERGAVREALHWLEAKRSLFCVSARLEELRGWCALLTSGGQEELGAAGREAERTPGATRWPARLRALVEPYDEGVGELNSASRVQEREEGEVESFERSSMGLACLAVFALAPDGTAKALRVDAAPALKDQVPEWLARRADACAFPEDPQQRLFVRAREVLTHRPKDRGVAALAGEAALALALTPILDPAGEVAGWIHLECEHHLLPGRKTRERLVHGWRDEVLRELGESRRSLAGEGLEAAEGGSPVVFEEVAGCESAEVFEGLLVELGLGLAHRRVRGFDVDGANLIGVFNEGLGLTSAEDGGGRALFRSLQSGGAVLFEDRDERLALHARAGCGFVVPVRLAGKLIGLFSVESSRRRDLAERETRQALELASQCAVPLACAQFAREHRGRHGLRPFFDAKREDFAQFFQRAMRAARSREALALSGARGSGKRIFARLLASLAGIGEPAEWTVEARELERDLEGWVERLVARCGDCVVLDGVEELDFAGQARLLRAVEQAGPSAPRLWTRLSRPFSEQVAEGRLTRELALRLGRLELSLPPLSTRREEIPALSIALLERLAQAEDRSAPELDDEGLALLWRQPWPGNIRELEATLARALHEAGECLTSETLEAGALLTPPVARIASRSPSRTDLVSALWTTRKRNGRGNRRRAALYLGWDPETLARRCTEANLSLDDLEVPTPWQTPPT